MPFRGGNMTESPVGPTIDNKFAKQCKWACDKLRVTGGVKKEELEAEFQNQADWSRVREALAVILHELGVPLKPHGRADRDISLKGPFARIDFWNEYFTSYGDDDSPGKERIGDLVAHYLKKRPDLGVLLGSGSTVYHVGLKMQDKARQEGPYVQPVLTVNIPLVAQWCKYKEPRPVGEVHILEGELDTERLRYQKMGPQSWNIPVVVVGVDGVLYDRFNKRASLYAAWEGTAHNTNMFIGKATYSILFCVVSRKLDYKEGRGQKSGPWIELPVPDNDDVKKYLVTNAQPTNKLIVEAFKRPTWRIITKTKDWPSRNEEEGIQAAEGAAITHEQPPAEARFEDPKQDD